MKTILEKLSRSVDRLEKLVEMNAPEAIIKNEFAIMNRYLALLDSFVEE